MPFAAHPSYSERIATGQRCLIHKEEHVGPLAIRDRIQRRKHVLDPALVGRHRKNAEVFNTKIVNMPLLTVRFVVSQHFL